VTCVPEALLIELASRVPAAPPQDPRPGTTQAFDLEKWITDRGLDVSEPSDWKGGRKWIFPTCPWNSNHDNRSAYILQFPNGAIAAGCLHNGCRGKGWHELRDLIEPRWRVNPRPRSGAPTPASTYWEAPVPFHQFDLPPFPTEALPDWLQNFVQAVATATQTPIDLAAMLALAVVAASCAKKVAVCLKPGYVEPANIFVVVAMEPGTRKTSVFRIVLQPLDEYERAEVRRVAPEIAHRKSALKIKEAKLKKLQDRAVSAKGSDQEAALTVEVAALAAELAAAVVPESPRYLADDCTVERLATLLRDQGGRIAVMSPEGDVFDLMAGRYSKTGAGNFGVYLKGHAGDTLRIDRVGRPPEFVAGPALTVGLAVQPEVIRGLIDKPGFRGRGLLGRFLYSLPDSLLGHRDTNPPPVPDDFRAAYYAKVHALLEIPFERDDQGEPLTRELWLEASARTCMQEFEAWVEPQLSEFGELGGITDWAGKAVGAVGRIAGILHMAVFAGTPAPWEYPISRETVANAIRIGKYLIPQAKAAFAEMGADPFVNQAKMVLRWIEQNTLMCFTKRELHQALRGRFKRVEEVEQPLALLVSRSFIAKQEEVPSGGPGRRPSPIYDVNPLWASQHAGRAQAAPARDNSEYCEDSEKGVSQRCASAESEVTSPQVIEKVGLE
jgi:replicative DNA helicase